MFIVSAGKAFLDIDAFACAIAYAELLRLEGKEAIAALIGPLNHSVSFLCQSQKVSYLTSYQPRAEDRLIYVDLSNPTYFAFPELNESQVDEIYDHHYGFEDYWTSRLGTRSHIERVGAAATQIWEEYKKRGFQEKISPESANLLLIAILQNTLNFTSTETHQRDRVAFSELLAHSRLPNNWEKMYFDELTQFTHSHFEETLMHDTKEVDVALPNQLLIFSQLEITEDPELFFSTYRSQIDQYWSQFKDVKTLINIADIASKRSLLYSSDSQWLHEQVETLFDVVLASKTDSILIPIHQRKQILKLLQESQRK